MSSKKSGKKRKGTKHKRVAFKDDWQLEAQVNTSLPPLVKGVLRGYVRVCVEGVMWEYSVGPPAPKLCTRLKWWGEHSPGTTFRVPVQMQSHTERLRRDCTTLAYYPVYSGWPQLQAYLKDMGSLLFQIGLGHMTDDSTVIGQAVVTNLAGLSATNPIKGQYPIVNSDGVIFGKLHVRVSLEPSQVSEKLPGEKDTGGAHSEFVVGPGVKPNKDGSRSSTPEEDVSTIIGYLNSGERTDMLVDTTGGYTQQTSAGSYTKPPIHIPTSGTAVAEAGSRSLPPKYGGDSGSSTVQQIEVISELIARGRKLRDAMVHSVLEPQGTLPDREGSKTWSHGGDQREPPLSGSLPLLSMELTQKQKSVHKGGEGVQRTSHTGITRKEERFLEAGDPLLGSRDKEVLELVLRNTGESELNLDGVFVELSSEEEEEEGGRGMGDECSMNESDYPLYSDSLLQNLLYDDPGQLEDTAEHTGAIASILDDPGNMRREAAVTKSVDGPSLVSERHIVDPFQRNLPGAEDICSKLPGTGSHSKTRSGSSSTAGGTLVPPILPNTQSIPSEQTGSQQYQVSETLSSELEAGQTDSLSTLSSFMGRHDRSLETAILRLIGMEKLTKLGRVNSARVQIECLQVDHSAVQNIHAVQKKKKRMVAGAPLLELSSASATYFVEYQFPAMVHKPHPGGTRRPSLLPSREIMRIASKKTKSGIVSFSHRSMFPVVFNSHVIRQWWNSSLVFRVYCRPPSERMPFLLGKAVVPFQQWLVAPSFNFQCQLDVRSSTLAKDVSEVDPAIGKLEVVLQLVVGKKQQQGDEVLPRKAPSPVEEEEKREVPLEEEEEIQQTVKLREKDFNPTIDITRAQSKPPALQLLLLIPEGTSITAPSAHQRGPTVEHTATTTTVTGAVGSVPNCYLVCKLFCATPHPKTPVQWASPNPPFGFRQVLCSVPVPRPSTPPVFDRLQYQAIKNWRCGRPGNEIYPLYLTPSLLDQVCNNFTVIEVWHKTPGATTEDDLIGLVKLSLHQFYLAYSEESSADLCREAELPVVAVDCYCPIVSPFTGAQQGHLAVLLALGTSNQVSLLQQHFARGSYLLQKPHRSPWNRGATAEKADAGLVVPRGLHQLDAGEGPDEIGGQCRTQHSELREEPSSPGSVRHVFVVTVDGVRGLAVFSNTVWGEADCFVQYHFPTTGERDEEEDPEVFLHPYRTGTTLCMPNPAFNYETRHTFLLPQTCPLQRELMGACGSGGVPFELWRRFYYPNIRDQLVAKASLPLAKLCAMVTMQMTAQPSVQSFSLPLKLVSEDRKAESGGLLDVTVKYEALSEGTGEMEEEVSHEEKTHVNLSIGILRAAGLKDAALLAANDHPVPLGFAAEAGVNTYAKISIPSLLHQEKRTTKTIARCFAPDYSHFFDLALPLLQLQDDRPHRAKGHKHTASKSKSAVSLAERLARGSVLLEIWHQVPRKEARTGPTEVRVFGRQLGPAFRDILLGYVEIPLVQLLQKHTGVRGWFPLHPPKSSDDRDRQSASEAASPDTPPLEEYVGGVELSIFFTNNEDRKVILSSALKMGWKAPKSCSIDCPSLVPVLHTREEVMDDREVGCGVEGGEGWRLDLSVNSLWVPLDAVVSPVPTATNPTYKFCFIRYRFMDNSPVVTTPRAVTYAREGTACYQLNHRAELHTLASAQLKWYLNEESLEIQVWGCVVTGRRKSGAEGRPRAEDTLLGLAYVPLGELLGHWDESGPQISGRYPIFKPGVDSLGGQALQVEIRRVVLEATEKAERGEVEILDSTTDEDERGDYPPPTARLETGPEENTTGQPPPEEEEEVLRDVFEARMVVHQALHLPLLTDCQQPESDWPPSAYVTVHPHPSVDKITTPVVPGNRKPVWEYQCATHVPNLYLESQCPGLEFQVWSKRPDGKRPQPQDGGQAEGGDSYLGSAHIDLSPLAYGLSQISGWYNVADFGGQVQGQLKVTVIPSQRISFPSPMLSYPAHVTSLVGRPNEFTAPQVHGSGLCCHYDTATEELALDLERLSQCRPAKSDQLSSKTTSVLFRQLRENIQELDKIHESLKAKLQDSEDWSGSSIPGRRQRHTPQPSSIPPRADQLISTTTAGDLQAEGDGTEVASRETHAPDEQVHGDRGGVTPNTSDASSVSSSHPVMHHGHMEPPGVQTSSTETLDQGAPFELLPSSHDGGGVPLEPNSPGTDQRSTSGGISPVLMPGSSSVGSNSPDSSVVMSSHNETFSLTDVSACSLELFQPAATASDHHLQFAHGTEEEEGLGSRPTEYQQQGRDSQSADAEILQPSPQTPDVSSSEEPPTPRASQLSQVDDGSHVDHSTLAPRPEDHKVKGLSTLCVEKTTAAHFVVEPREEKGGLKSRTSVLLTSPSSQTPGGDTTTAAFSTERNGDKNFRGSSQVETSSRETHVQQHAQRRVPALVTPGIHLPNFFMPPHELEQSMRSLRASVLSRPPPRRQAADQESAPNSHVSTMQGFRTLQEVNRYLDSRRTGDAGQAREISASQTQRIARIFSSKPAHVH